MAEYCTSCGGKDMVIKWPWRLFVRRQSGICERCGGQWFDSNGRCVDYSCKVHSIDRIEQERYLKMLGEKKLAEWKEKDEALHEPSSMSLRGTSSEFTNKTMTATIIQMENCNHTFAQEDWTDKLVCTKCGYASSQSK